MPDAWSIHVQSSSVPRWSFSSNHVSITNTKCVECNIELKYILDFLLPMTMSGGARYSFVVRAFAHGVTGRRIDPSWSGPIELFLVPDSAPRLV